MVKISYAYSDHNMALPRTAFLSLENKQTMPAYIFSTLSPTYLKQQQNVKKLRTEVLNYC